MNEEIVSYKITPAEIWEPTNHLRQFCKPSGSTTFDYLELQQLWVSNFRNTEWRSIEIVKE